MIWSHIESSILNFTFGLLFITMLIYWLGIAFPLLQYSFKLAKKGLIVSCICLSVIINLKWILNQYFPLSNLYESLLFLAWCIVFITIVIERQTTSRLIGAITTPLVMLITAFSSLFLPSYMQETVPLVPALQSNWLMMHVSVMILSYAALIIGSLLSVLFLILTDSVPPKLQDNSISTLRSLNRQSRLTTQKLTIAKYQYANKVYNNHNSINRLSLIESIDNLSYRIIGFGFPLLTLGIIAGAVWANEAWGSYWSWDPKETWALITWLIFAGYLHARFNKSWQGKKPAILASVGFFVIWICYLGVNFLGQGLHNYGWIL
uniref:Cytochrome c biogenesis protein CcsA n=1 Tax=Hildenbrandia rivularis TaxID=135206 RepID=A0A1C9CFE7_9FLOR|nr:cytochrome c biogenesis protein [Hildenbrandia rivularis]AOM67138.1 cytochrome c biogenesis protein [Hildenbrandia rivularis]